MFKMPLLNMSEGKKTYWKGIEQLKNDPAFVKNAPLMSQSSTTVPIGSNNLS